MDMVWKIVIIGAATIIGVGAKYVFHKDDSVVEEVAEDVIASQTSNKVDLTPESKE